MGVAFGAVIGQFCNFLNNQHIDTCNCWYISTTHVYTHVDVWSPPSTRMVSDMYSENTYVEL